LVTFTFGLVGSRLFGCLFDGLVGLVVVWLDTTFGSVWLLVGCWLVWTFGLVWFVGSQFVVGWVGWFGCLVRFNLLALVGSFGWFGCLVIYRLPVGLLVGYVGWLWLFGCTLVYVGLVWLVGWFVYCPVWLVGCWFTLRLVGSFGWLVPQLGWLVGCIWLVGRASLRLVGWLVGWLFTFGCVFTFHGLGTHTHTRLFATHTTRWLVGLLTPHGLVGWLVGYTLV